MIVKSVHIQKFRAFEDVEIELGKGVTAIVGQNGTLKSTLLGIIAQPFSLRNSPLSKTRGIDGNLLESKFADKFKLSRRCDNVEEYVWTLNFFDREAPSFKSRGEYRSDTIIGVRFWNAEGGRQKGTGYIQYPVIFLSLKRLIPLGEEKEVKRGHAQLDEEELNLYRGWHNNILSIEDDITSVANIVSVEKNTLAPETDIYDAFSISAGQDNIGKIIMAVLSFRRMKLTLPSDYHGGLLLIDEVDSTLFPSAQKHLVEYLFDVSKRFNIQVIFTTHSLSAVEGLYETLEKHYNQYNGKVVVLEKINQKVVQTEKNDFASLAHLLNITIPAKSRSSNGLKIYCEDPEAMWFAKKILYGWIQQCQWMKNVNLGCSNYKNLIDHHVPEFLENIIILDGDASRIKFSSKSPVLFLPGNGCSPEALFYNFLSNLGDDDEFWSNGYRKQACFKVLYGKEPKKISREEFKKWFTDQKPYWGTAGKRLYDKWLNSSDENKTQVEKFRNDFMALYKRLTGRTLSK